MAYTAYRTWTTGEIVTAALMNEQVKDNGLLTAPAIMTTAGDIIYASAANTPARLAKSTTSTQYLANTGTSNVPAWNEVALTTGVSGTLPVGNGGTGITSLGSNVATFLGTPSSANLRSALTDETGTGGAVFATSPTLVTPALGTPSALVATNASGTASSLTAGTVTTNANLTGHVTSSGNAAVLGSFSSAQLKTALSDETGSGAAVFATSPTLVTPALGTPSAGVLTSCTGLPEAGLAVSNSPTNGYMLTAQSGDAGGMTWAAAGGGALVLINTTVATDDATIGVTGLDSTYDTYLILLSDVVPENDSDGRIQLGDSSGIDEGASDYAYHFNSPNEASTAYNGVVSDGDTGFRFQGAGIGNQAGEGLGAAFWLHKPGDGTTQPMVSGTMANIRADGNVSGGQYVGRRKAVINVDRVQFKFDSGDVATGRLSVYGVSHA